MFSLREAALERWDAPAVVTAAGVLTFGELWRRVRPVTQALRGVNRSRGVAVVAGLHLHTLLAIYALVELGIPLVPIHPRLTAAERAALVALSGAQLVLDETWTPPDPASCDLSDGAPPTDASEEDPLAVLFTSGSSGAPKGVELSRRAFRASAVGSATNLGWRSDDRWLLCMPLAHVGGLSVVLRCLAARVPLVLSPWTGSVPGLLADIDALGATLLSLVPTMLARVLEEDASYRFPPHVRAVLLGGDAAGAALLAAAEERDVAVLTTYGMTEACSQIATLAPGDRPVGNGVGRPLPGTSVRVVDGHIQVRGPTLFTRYLAAPRDDAPTASAPPFLNDGWFVTGDLGRIDDSGRLHVTGRSSDLIITGGENVDPRDVEAALESCAGVRAACVFPVPDERWGQVVAAALVLDGDAAGHLAAKISTVSSEVRGKLAAHKWPRRWAVVDALVLNSSSKLDRRRTATLAMERLHHA